MPCDKAKTATPLYADIDRFLSICEDGTVIYVGYTLALSPMERCILHCLLEQIATDNPTYLTKEQLIEAMAASFDAASKDAMSSDAPSHRRISAGQLSVHITRINRKAYNIGGRTLILCKRNRGYLLNPFL